MKTKEKKLVRKYIVEIATNIFKERFCDEYKIVNIRVNWLQSRKVKSEVRNLYIPDESYITKDHLVGGFFLFDPTDNQFGLTYWQKTKLNNILCMAYENNSGYSWSSNPTNYHSRKCVDNHEINLDKVLTESVKSYLNKTSDHIKVHHLTTNQDSSLVEYEVSMLYSYSDKIGINHYNTINILVYYDWSVEKRNLLINEILEKDLVN